MCVNGFVFLEQPLKGLDKLPKVLSTPHGTLGTVQWGSEFCLTEPLSTPRGTLGTPNDHINQNKTYQSFCQGGAPSK